MSIVNFNNTTPAAPGGNTNVTFQQSGDSVSAYAPDSTSPLTTKGDIWGYNTGNARIPVGSNGEVLTADSTNALGVSWQSGGGGLGVLGTAVFSATGGTISGLVTAGNVTGVTRTGTGQYAVALSGSPSNYIVHMTAGDTANIVTMQIDPASSYASSGFTAQCIGGSAAYDPALVFITIIG